MTWYDDESELDYEDKHVVREAVLALIDRHRAEYDEIVTAAQTTRVAELEDQLRRKEVALKAVRERLAKYEKDRARWAQRIASGVTVKAKR